MKKANVILTLVAVAVFAMTADAATIAQIDFTSDGTAPAGWNKAGTVTPLDDPTGTATDINMDITNPFGWSWDQGPNTSYTADNGVVFPAAVADKLSADNVGVGARDGLAVIQLSSPTQYNYESPRFCLRRCSQAARGVPGTALHEPSTHPWRMTE